MKACAKVARRLIIGLILLIGAGPLLPAQQPPANPTSDAPLSVCDLLADLRSFDLKRVVVRGELLDSLYGLSMGAADCEGKEFAEGNHSWPAVIDLFPASEENFREQDLILKFRDGWKTGRPRAIATATGILHVPTAEQAKRGRGLGGLRNFPAQIRYDRVSDIEFEVLPHLHGLPVVSVCVVLSNLQQYRSQRVAIRGQLNGGYHGSFLSDDCAEPPVLGGVHAPATISLGQPDYYPGPEMAPDFGIRRPVEGMPREPSVKELTRGRNSIRVWGTYIGVLRAHEEYLVWCAEGRARPVGFGHLNAAPAELLVEDSYGFQVEPADEEWREPELDRCIPAPPMDGKTCEERTDLGEAVVVGCSRQVEQLLAAGADPNMKSEDGWTVLLAAIQQGSLDMVRLLLAAGANPQAPPDETPLCVAAEHDRPEIARLLIDLGAGVEPSNETSCAPLVEAAGNGSSEVVRLLLSAGANPNTRTKTGVTPLAAAASAHKIENMKLLLAAGADPNALDNDGEAYLPDHGYFNRSVAEELIRAGASVDATTRGGRTALMGACEFGRRAVAELLLRAGANPNRKDNAGDTPLLHAVRGGYVDCIPLLATHGADFTVTNLEGQTARDLVTGNNAPYLYEALDQVSQAGN